MAPPAPAFDDVAAIERATLCAVPPRERQEREGWLLAFDEGTVGRAHSAAPLRHEPPSPDCAAVIESLYRAQGLRPVLRLPAAPAFGALHSQLLAEGWRRGKPTLVQVATAEDVLAVADARDVTLETSPGDAWAAAFLGEGFDPVDAASRLGILRRARESLFASVLVDGEVAAVGSACLAGGWCGLHGMRTAPAHRGRGHAARVLAALARAALERGIARAFLQVEEGNAPARALYARAGFATAWKYEYWTAPA